MKQLQKTHSPYYLLVVVLVYTLSEQISHTIKLVRNFVSTLNKASGGMGLYFQIRQIPFPVRDLNCDSCNIWNGSCKLFSSLLECFIYRSCAWATVYKMADRNYWREIIYEHQLINVYFIINGMKKGKQGYNAKVVCYSCKKSVKNLRNVVLLM